MTDEAFPSRWTGWRKSRLRAAAIASLGPPPLQRDCATCWGQRMVWEPGPLGLLPVACPGCAGTGRVPAAG